MVMAVAASPRSDEAPTSCFMSLCMGFCQAMYAHDRRQGNVREASAVLKKAEERVSTTSVLDGTRLQAYVVIHTH